MRRWRRRAQGYHGAIIRNDLTCAFEEVLTEVADLHDTNPEQALALMTLARIAFADQVMKELGCTETSASTEEVRGVSFRPYPHTDLLTSLYFLIIASRQPTIVYATLPNHIDPEKPSYDSFPTADGGKKYIKYMDRSGEDLSASIDPERGSAVVLFPYNGRTLAHSEPDIQQMRALSTLHFS